MVQQSTIQFFDDPTEGYRLHAEMVVPLGRAEVFDFFADAQQLERITPPWLNFNILTPMPIEMGQGALLDYKIRLHYIPIYWRTRICTWEPNVRFVDEQLRGPYKRWYHEHTFEDVDGGTLVRDDVHYIPRGGSLLHRWMVRPDLEKIFQFRQDRLFEIFSENVSGKANSSILPPTPGGLATETARGINS